MPKSKPTEKVCARTACDSVLNRGFWRIFNVHEVEDGHRDYCAKCGRGIMEYDDPKFPLRNERYDRTGNIIND